MTMRSPIGSPISRVFRAFGEANASLVKSVFAGAAAAFSVRLPKNSTYTGPLLRVRRSSDDAVLDVGALAAADANGDRWLDLDALTLFCGAPQRPLPALSVATAVAFSLRRVGDYNGPAIRVRRSSDNVETNVGFDANGDLDTVVLLAFCGAGNGFLTTWYDQSGNARNWTQASQAAQPRIVNAGVIETLGGRPTVRGLGAQWMVADWTPVAVPGISLTATWRSDSTAATPQMFDFRDARDGQDLFDDSNGGGANVRARNAAGLLTSTAGTSRNLLPHVSTYAWDGATLSMRQDGTAIGSTALGGTMELSRVALFTNAISQGTAVFTGAMSEFIATFVNPTTNDRTLLEQSQAARYGVALATAIPSGFVATWYDQSGFARHATQTTAGSQPRIVDAGVVGRLNSEPAINLVSDASLNATDPLGGDNTLDVTINKVGTAGYGRGRDGFGAGWSIQNPASFVFTSPLNSYAATAPGTGDSTLSTLRIDQAPTGNSTAQLFYSGVAGTQFSVNNRILRSSTVGLVLGASNGTASPGTCSEFVVFPSALSTTDRQTLEQSQGSAFGIIVS